MDLQILDQLNESRLFRTKTAFQNYNLEQISEMLYLNLLALVLLKNDFDYAGFVSKYAMMCNKFYPWKRYTMVYNDMSMMLWMIFGEKQGGNKPTDYIEQNANDDIYLQRLRTMDTKRFRQWLILLKDGKSTEMHDRKYLMWVERQLNIRREDYKLIRYNIGHWSLTTHDSRKTTMTRLLMAFRTRMRMSEVLPLLEQKAKTDKLEKKNVKNLEAEEEAKTDTDQNKLLDYAKYLAAFAGGAYLGSKLGDDTQS